MKTEKTERNPRGAGRKPIPESDLRATVTIRLPKDLIARIDESGLGKTAFIEEAVNEKLKSFLPNQAG